MGGRAGRGLEGGPMIASSATAGRPSRRRPSSNASTSSACPMDLGADRRGVDMGPRPFRYARLKEGLQTLGIAKLFDHGNLHVPVPESASPVDKHAKYLSIIRDVCNELADVVAKVVTGRRVSGRPRGDHSIAIGTLPGSCARASRSRV